jgi:YD repeat-containing protein
MTTSKGYDALNRLTNIVSSGTGFQAVSFAYQYNSANQRTAITNADDSKWLYTSELDTPTNAVAVPWN